MLRFGRFEQKVSLTEWGKRRFSIRPQNYSTEIGPDIDKVAGALYNTKGPMTPSDIGRYAGMSRRDVKSTIDLMEAAGLVYTIMKKPFQ